MKKLLLLLPCILIACKPTSLSTTNASTHYLPSPFENIYLDMSLDSILLYRPEIIRVHSLVETAYIEYTEELDSALNSVYYYFDPQHSMLKIVKLVFTNPEPLKRLLDQMYVHDENKLKHTSKSNPNVVARMERNNLFIQFEKNEINPNNQ